MYVFYHSIKWKVLYILEMPGWLAAGQVSNFYHGTYVEWFSQQDDMNTYSKGNCPNCN